MSYFQYQAKDSSGKEIIDKIEAEDQNAALSILEDKGYLVTSITECANTVDEGKKKRSVKNSSREQQPPLFE